MTAFYNVYPVDDLQEHNTDGEDGKNCHCKPRIEEVDDGLLIIHNSFDGRELWEKFEEIHGEIVQ